MAGVEVQFEPTHLDQATKLRPDLLLYTHPKLTVSDIVVSNPAAPSHCATASNVSLRIADQAANKKQKKYRNITKNLQADFKACACEVFGGMHKQAKQLVNRIAHATEMNGSLYTVREIRNELMDEIAVGLVRGNAHMIAAGETYRKKAICQI